MRRRAKARLIIPVWGDYHAREVLTEASLRSLLAPGNLPALADHLDCELRLLTEPRLIEFFESSDVVRAVKGYARVSYDSIEDLLCVSNYSMPLTLALFRGMADLGEGVKETYLFFLNVDFVLADGSYRTVVDKIEAGETLILAPSLRAAAERALPALIKAKDPCQEHIALPPRALVELTLSTLHPMPRAKIVNRPFWHPDRIDQFYWAVGGHALIGFQFPMAIVCVKPEAVPPQIPPCFFDYCSLPVLAPHAPRCVLADSDRFFMMELQSRTAGFDHVRPGWPTLDEIAADLSDWTTKEQRELGRQLLYFHVKDLDGAVAPYEAEARRFMDALGGRLSPTPRSHLDHPFWLPAYGFFAQARAERQVQDGVAGGGPHDGDGHGEAGVTERLAQEAEAVPLSFRLTNRLRRAGHRTLGAVPEVRRAHPLWPYYADTVEAFRRTAAESGDVLTLLPKGSVFKNLLRQRPGSVIAEYDSVAGDFERRTEIIRQRATCERGAALLFVHLETLDEVQARLILDIIDHLPGDSRVLAYIEMRPAGIFLSESSRIARYIDGMLPLGIEGRMSFFGTRLGSLGAAVMRHLVSSFYNGRYVGFALWSLASASLLPLNLLASALRGTGVRPRPTRLTTAALVEGRLQMGSIGCRP